MDTQQANHVPFDIQTKKALAASPLTSEKILLSFVGDEVISVRETLLQNPKPFDGSSFNFPNPCAHAYLRLVREIDSEFILSLRTDPQLNKHLSSTSIELELQNKWLVQYFEREKKRQEFYFIICDSTGEPLGTARIYDTRPGSFCWGSWLMTPKAPVFAAISSALNLYEIGFYTLGFSHSHFDVRKQNTKVVDFHIRFGASIISEDNDNYYFSFPKTKYEKTKKRYAKLFK